MGKHRELAKELYASRIWRTVVFAGAMLGTPAVASAEQAKVPTQAANPPAKPAPATGGAGGGVPSAGAPAIVAAPPKADPITAKATALQTANTERDGLITKLGEVEVTEIDKVKKDLVAKDAQIKKLVDELIALRKPRPRTPPTVRPVGRGFVLA